MKTCNYVRNFATQLECGMVAHLKLRGTDIILCKKHAKEFPEEKIVSVHFEEHLPTRQPTSETRGSR